jgi:hypothetical protein
MDLRQVFHQTNVACFNSGESVEDRFIGITEMLAHNRQVCRPGLRCVNQELADGNRIINTYAGVLRLDYYEALRF